MKKHFQLNYRKTRYFWVLLGCIVLMPFFTGCGIYTEGQYANPYNLGKEEPYGIVEFFNITHPLLIKGLEQGPESIGEMAIWMYNPKDHKCEIVGTTGQPQAGDNLPFSNLSISFHFQLSRIALPPGKYRRFYVAALPSHMFIMAATPYTYGSTTYYYNLKDAFHLRKVITVYPNRISLVRIHAEVKNRRLIYQVFQPHTTLPIPSDPKEIFADPNSINELFELLKEEDWGFRYYAAKRLGILGDKRSIQPLQEALEKEKHIDVRKAMEDALKKSQ